jgi:hypothetical protein
MSSDPSNAPPFARPWRDTMLAGWASGVLAGFALRYVPDPAGPLLAVALCLAAGVVVGLRVRVPPLAGAVAGAIAGFLVLPFSLSARLAALSAAPLWTAPPADEDAQARLLAEAMGALGWLDAGGSLFAIAAGAGIGAAGASFAAAFRADEPPELDRNALRRLVSTGAAVPLASGMIAVVLANATTALAANVSRVMSGHPSSTLLSAGVRAPTLAALATVAAIGIVLGAIGIREAAHRSDGRREGRFTAWVMPLAIAAGVLFMAMAEPHPLTEPGPAAVGLLFLAAASGLSAWAWSAARSATVEHRPSSWDEAIAAGLTDAVLLFAATWLGGISFGLSAGMLVVPWIDALMSGGSAPDGAEQVEVLESLEATVARGFVLLALVMVLAHRLVFLLSDRRALTPR